MKANMNNTFRAVLLASVAAGGISIPHFAAAAEAAAAATQVEEIVVTGSRIKRDTFNTPVPVSVVTGDQIRDSGRISVAEVLMDTPVINANTNAQNSSGTLFLAGQARADIRGLGTSRTLVLMDGRRIVFSDASSPGVDLNMIPSMMVDKIDTVPGGGSAVYGSEAIAGVVNLIMKKSYDGFQFDAQGGLTGEGDGAQWRAAGMYGGKFANDRLNVLVGGEASRTEVIMQKDRDWAYPGIRRNPGVFGALNAVQGIVPATKSNTAPTATFELTSSTDPSKALAYTLDYRNPTSVVKLSPQCSTPTVQPTCQDDALFYSASLNALQGRASRGIGRFYADYQLTDNVKAFTDIMYSKVIGFGVFQPAFSSAAGGGTMPVALKGDNAYLLNGATSTDLALKADWLAAGKALTSASTAQVGKFWGEFGGRNVRTERETTRVVVGMNGDLEAFTRKLSWDWYYQYGETSGSTTSYNVPNVQKVQWATDAITVGGAVVCRATTVAATAAAAAGCVPWNLIDGGSAAAIAYTNAQSTTTQDVKQSVLAGNVTADLLQLPAGPLAFALGAEYRQEQSEFVQDALGASGALFFNAIGTRAGKYNVGETYAELRIPILKDIPFAKELTVELAGRHSNYSTINRTNQYSARVEWTPVQDLTFRANQGTAVRAPNIVELFSPQSVNFTTAATDPCDKDSFSGATAAQKALRSVTCAAAIPGYNSSTFVSNFGPGRSSLQLLQGGNPGLGPETAHTYQLGFVAQPRWVPHLQIALDYFKYNIDNQVGTIPINTLITNLCYESTTAYAANPFCALIKRDPTGASAGVVGGVTTVVLTNQNVAKVKVEGYDASVQYGVNLEDWFKKDLGSLALRVDATWEYRFALQGLPGQAFTQLANNISNATPEWKGLITAQWTYHDLQLAWTTHYIGTMASTTAFAPTALSPYYTGDYYMHDVRASYKVSDKLSVRGGILNVTDEPPPALPETFAGTGTGSSTYDNRGRYFYVGANLKY